MRTLRLRVAHLAEAARQRHWVPHVNLSGATTAQLRALARLPLVEGDDGTVTVDLSGVTADQLREIEAIRLVDRGRRLAARL
jgi:hypothetical protein